MREAWTIVAGKNTGLQPGFRAVITGASDKQLYQVEFDPPGYPGLATGAEMIGTLLYHALGYHVVENYIVYVDPATLTIDPKATYRDRDGRRQPFTRTTLERMLWRAATQPRRHLPGAREPLRAGQAGGPVPLLRHAAATTRTTSTRTSTVASCAPRASSRPGSTTTTRAPTTRWT